MQKTETGTQDQSASEQNVKPQLTPHQLYNYHILHPDEPITDEDIRNLKIDSGGVYKDHELRDGEPVAGETIDEKKDKDTTEEREAANERPIESPYDILNS